MVKIKLTSPYLIASLGLASAMILIVFALMGTLPPEVPLLYGAAEGEAQLVSSWVLAAPGAFSILVVLINSALLGLTKDEFTKKVLAVSALIVTLFSAVTTLKIIMLIASF